MKFDLVIIDEASQMRPEDALGALLRARQIVVVGDPKQLPPTDFFNRVVEDQDDDEVADDIKDESILEACSKSFNRLRSLKWHYRSRCESLIDFSNREFYEKSLITFPMARPNSFSIDLVQVDGIYEANQNAAEAQRICEEAIGLMRRMADAPADEFGTIIIVTINSTQRERIKEEFRRLAAGDAAVERFMERAEAKGEPFDVKNLENVQGDERDFVMISLVYGREAGRNVVKQTFGPINRSEGHRRLNVLFSRARRRIGLFTSMRSTDIRPTEQSKRGVHVLKGYLEYAERRGGPDGVVTGKDYDSPFEQAVAERLRAKGLDLDIQVGVSRFRIDLAVRHPMEPSAYVAGIECDGAAYHSSKSARDRDRLREEVLRDLKWEILRVWSTDWFEDPARETNRLVERINALASKPIRMPDEVMFGSGEISPVAAGGQAQPITVPDDEPRPGQFELTFQEPPKPTKPVGPSLLSGTGKLTRAETKMALEELRRLIEAEMPDAEPHRGILREAMIEHFIGGRIDDPSKWFARIPTFIRQGCDPAQKNAYLDRICEVVDRMV
jgi:very-short-patch-repair endonuclease